MGYCLSILAQVEKSIENLSRCILYKIKVTKGINKGETKYHESILI